MLVLLLKGRAFERLSFGVPMPDGFILVLDHLQLVIRDNSIRACWLSGKGKAQIKTESIFPSTSLELISFLGNPAS